MALRSTFPFLNLSFPDDDKKTTIVNLSVGYPIDKETVYLGNSFFVNNDPNAIDTPITNDQN
jgi:hypothetical protein